MSEFIVELTEDNRDLIIGLCDGIHNEIVRCKDCKRFHTNTNGFDCPKLELDGFCAWGDKVVE